MNSLFLRAAAVLLFAGFVLLAVQEKNKPERPGTGASMMDEIDGVRRDEVKPPPGGWQDTGKMLLYFAGSLGLGGFMLLRWVLPALTDRIGSASAPDPVLDPHGKAMVQASEGDFPGALLTLARMARENPSDRLPVTEMARIHSHHLQDPESAANILETALQREWPGADRLLFLQRLADLYCGPLDDTTRARDTLQQILTVSGGGDAAAAARLKLDEIDEREFLDRQQDS